MKLFNSDEKRCPKLVKYLKKEFPNLLKKGAILKGLEAAGIDYKEAVIFTSYGYDPLIDIKTLPKGDIMGWKVLNKAEKSESVPRIYGMQISTKLVKAFNRDDDFTNYSIAGPIRMIDATLLVALVAWRKLAEALGKVYDEELEKVIDDFIANALGEQRKLINPFL